jgi:hypothetical protein
MCKGWIFQFQYSFSQLSSNSSFVNNCLLLARFIGIAELRFLNWNNGATGCKKARPGVLFYQQVGLTTVAIIAASKCVARTITGTTGGIVAAAILVIAETALRTARLTGALSAKSLSAANAQSMAL